MSIIHYALHLRLNDPKYRAAFHEVGHLIVLKQWKPTDSFTASIHKKNLWCGLIKPEPNYCHSIDAAKVMVAGLAAEFCYEKVSWREARSIFQKDTVVFGGDWYNYKNNLSNTRQDRIALSAKLCNKADNNYREDVVEDYGYFAYLYEECFKAFIAFGEDKMHKLAKRLYLKGSVTI